MPLPSRVVLIVSALLLVVVTRLPASVHAAADEQPQQCAALVPDDLAVLGLTIVRGCLAGSVGAECEVTCTGDYMMVGGSGIGNCAMQQDGKSVAYRPTVKCARQGKPQSCSQHRCPNEADWLLLGDSLCGVDAAGRNDCSDKACCLKVPVQDVNARAGAMVTESSVAVPHQVTTDWLADAAAVAEWLAALQRELASAMAIDQWRIIMRAQNLKSSENLSVVQFFVFQAENLVADGVQTVTNDEAVLKLAKALRDRQLSATPYPLLSAVQADTLGLNHLTVCGRAVILDCDSENSALFARKQQDKGDPRTGESTGVFVVVVVILLAVICVGTGLFFYCRKGIHIEVERARSIVEQRKSAIYELKRQSQMPAAGGATSTGLRDGGLAANPSMKVGLQSGEYHPPQPRTAIK